MDANVEAVLNAAEHPVLRGMIQLWDERRAGRPLPSRADFDPVDMKFALGDISLYDVEENPRRFWCRLDGTRQVELFGVDCTGRYLDEVFPPEHYALINASYGATIDQRRPHRHERTVPYAGRIIRYEMVCLPLSSDGGRVDRLMVVITPHWH